MGVLIFFCTWVNLLTYFCIIPFFFEKKNSVILMGSEGEEVLKKEKDEKTKRDKCVQSHSIYTQYCTAIWGFFGYENFVSIK